jgi:hypothetical protein
VIEASSKGVKTDRRDARVLVEMLTVGSVTEVRVPDPQEEALRDLSRLRSGTAKDLAHARQHVNAILRHKTDNLSRWRVIVRPHESSAGPAAGSCPRDPRSDATAPKHVVGKSF